MQTVGICRVIEPDIVEQAHTAGLRGVQGRPTPAGMARAEELGLRTLASVEDGDALSAWTAAFTGPLLIDGPRSGSGQIGDLERIARIARERPLVLAGGLSPDNVAAAIEQVRPAGVDVSSGVERSRGVKDPALIREFVQTARAALDRAAYAAGDIP